MRKPTLLRAFGTWTLLVAVSWALASSTSWAKPQCLDGREAALKAGGFSGRLLCSSKDASFKFAGTLHEANRSYIVYSYRYRFLAVAGGVMHGGHRVIIFTPEGKYLGQYALTPPPPFDVVINHSSIVISAEGQLKGTIPFKNGPPPSALVDGEPVAFFK